MNFLRDRRPSKSDSTGRWSGGRRSTASVRVAVSFALVLLGVVTLWTGLLLVSRALGVRPDPAPRTPCAAAVEHGERWCRAAGKFASGRFGA